MARTPQFVAPAPRSDRRFDTRFDVRFAQQAARTPTRVALSEPGRSIQYEELRSRVDALVQALQTQGIGAGSLVGVHVERSIAYVTCVLALLALDATVLPLPPSYPAERLREIVAFAKPDAVIDAEATPFPPGIHTTLHHYEALARTGVAAALRPNTERSSDRAAFVLASSGSTGTPKLIVRSHASFFHRLEWTWTTHPYRDGEACCQKSHMTTTHAIYELFEPLLQGVSVHLISDAEVRDLEGFWETIRAKRITRLLIVPSVLQASLELPGFVAPPLMQLVLMGEPVHSRLAAAALERFPAPTRIHSIYGSTEASSTFDCDLRMRFRAGEPLPLGVPLSDEIHFAVLDDALCPVPVGEAGMLHIGGPPLFTEYHRAPELTAASFVSLDPGHDVGFAAGAATARLFATRDSVRRMPDGTMQFVGRVDNTVKIRGFRVDLDEVERAILLQSDVKQCAVVVRERGPGTDSLAAFVSPASVLGSEVLRRLRERLPAHMVPSLVTALAALPLTPSGKVDRRALALVREVPAALQPASGDSTWQRVAAVWSDVLERNDVARDSVFFDIGGTSLSVFTVLHRLREAFALDRRQLTDQSVYEHSSVDALAEHIDALRSGTVSSAAGAPSAPTVLVTLKKGSDPTLPPVFLIPSAGGTLGAYEKLLKVLSTPRAVIGVRDPFLWGQRDPTIGFQRWVAVFVEAIRARQPKGPYHIIGYSSAGSFSLEIAQHLRRAGEEVALLALIDTLALDRATKWRFGYWALEARFYRPIVGPVVRAIGWLRLLVPRALRANGRVGRDTNIVPTRDSFESLAEELRRSADHLRSLAALLELNTGLPFSLTAEEVAATAPEQYLALLLGRVKKVTPEIDTEMIANIVIQYRLQVRSQHEYRLQRYDGPVVLFEVHGPYFGMVAVLLRPYVKRLTLYGASLGEPTARTREISDVLTEPIRPHFQCMRDDAFVASLAKQLQQLL